MRSSASPPAPFVPADWTADLAALRALLRGLAVFGLVEAVPASALDPVAPADAEVAARALVTQAQTVLALAEKRVAAANTANTPPPVVPPPADPDAAAAAAAAARQALVDRLGRALREALGGDMPRRRRSSASPPARRRRSLRRSPIRSRPTRSRSRRGCNRCRACAMPPARLPGSRADASGCSARRSPWCRCRRRARPATPGSAARSVPRRCPARSSR